MRMTRSLILTYTSYKKVGGAIRIAHHPFGLTAIPSPQAARRATGRTASLPAASSYTGHRRPSSRRSATATIFPYLDTANRFRNLLSRGPMPSGYRLSGRRSYTVPPYSKVCALPPLPWAAGPTKSGRFASTLGMMGWHTPKALRLRPEAVASSLVVSSYSPLLAVPLWSPR